MFCPQCRVQYRPGFTHCTERDMLKIFFMPQDEARAREIVRGVVEGVSPE